MSRSNKTGLLIKWALRLAVVLGYGLILAPIVTLIIFSFNSARFPSLPWQGFTFAWYEQMLQDPEIVGAFLNSIKVAFSVGVLATVLGTLAAYLFSRWEFRGKAALLGFVMLPPAVPLLILALALLIYFSQLGFAGSLRGVVAGHVGLAASFVVGVVRLRLAELNSSLEEAAWNLGFGRWSTIRRVVLPQALPAIASGFFVAMAVSWDEFVISWFVSGFETTLPVKLYGIVNGYVSPVVNAIGSTVFVITVGLVASALLILRIGSRGNPRKGLGS